MPYEINIERKQGYIRVEITGKRVSGVNNKFGISMWARVAEACRSMQINRVLFIARLTGNLDTLDVYETARNPESFGWTRAYKLALVDLNDESRAANQFGETVAVNRGFNMKVFADEETGKTWLLQD